MSIPMTLTFIFERLSKNKGRLNVAPRRLTLPSAPHPPFSTRSRISMQNATSPSRPSFTPPDGSSTAIPKNGLSPEQVSFAELVGNLLAQQWRRDHEPDQKSGAVQTPPAEAAE
jgi:hypothetical protein